MGFRFEWDDEKAEANTKKHGVTFGEAATVFLDPLAAIAFDEEHSDDELRELIVGHSINGRLLIICFTERERVTRIISARRVTRNERRDYEQRPF